MRFNLHVAILTFALLAIGITLYPPWRWVPELKVYDPQLLPLIDTVPVEHAPLWGPTTKKAVFRVMTVGGPPEKVVIYDRFLDGRRLTIYYALAALISAVVGVLVVRRPKSDGL